MTTTPTNLPRYKGYIDWVSSGFIRGWVYSLDTPGIPVAFKLILDGIEILQSTADLYREDLAIAGFSDGVHGYCCQHNLSAKQLIGKTLQLVDLEDNLIGKSYIVPDENAAIVSVNNMSPSHYLLKYSIDVRESTNVTLQLLHDNKRYWQGKKHLKQGRNHIELPVCKEIVDSEEHAITLGMVGKVEALWQEAITVPIDALAIKYYSAVNNHQNKPAIVMIDRSIPKPDQDAGSYAATQEIRLLQALGFHIIFIPDDFTYSPMYTQKLQEIGVEVLFSPYFINSSDALLSILPTVCAVYITRYQYVEKHIKSIKEYSSSLPIIFNNADLHFLREIRQGNLLKDEALLQKAMSTRDREVKVMKQVDAILSYSEFEHAVITSHILKSDHIHKCPWVVEPPLSNASFDEREGIAFLGGYEHPANIGAVEFLIEQLMPLLRERGESIKLYIYGSHMPDYFHQYACDDIIFKGYVESLDDVFLNHRIFVAPLFFGAGVKGKVLSAAAYSMPCILSPIAIEATGLAHDISALIADTPMQWCNSVQRLYFNEKEWQFIARNAFSVINERYSFNKAKIQMQSILDTVALQVK